MENENIEINTHYETDPNRVRDERSNVDEHCEATLRDWTLNLNNPEVERCHVAMVTQFKDGTVSIDNLRRENDVLSEVTQTEVTFEVKSPAIARQVFESLDQHFTTMASEIRAPETKLLEEVVLDVGNADGNGLSLSFTPTLGTSDTTSDDVDEEDNVDAYGE